jgi:tRNA threonylcarbamoyladenosine modification (KEOPS) complex  Pcc1 subunit
MNLRAEIIVSQDADKLKKVFDAEEKAFRNKRADYEVKKSRNNLVFKIRAKDSSALRAVLNSITKMISVYENAKKVIKTKEVIKK